MKRDTINYTLVGAVVLLAFALLLFVLLRITGTSTGDTRYLARYDEVTGLSVGAPVFFEGFRVGQVASITPERLKGDTRFRVELDVREDWPIPEDSVARLASTGLLADVSVAIREGQSAQILKPGAEIKSMGGGDLFAAMNELAGELTILTRDKLHPLVDSLHGSVERIGTELESATPQLLTDAQTLLKRLNQASATVNDVLSADNRQHLSATFADAAATAAEVRQLASDLNQTRHRLDEVLASTHATVEENRPALRDAIADLSQITASLARRVDAIAQNLESSSRHINEFSREIRKNPNRLLFTPPADQVEVEHE